MTDNVLSRLRNNRNRQSVPLRDDPLVNTRSILDEAETTESIAAIGTLPKEAISTKSKDIGFSAIQELQNELGQFPPTKRHSGIVLDNNVDRDLTQYCKDNQITLELFLEACWETLREDNKTLSKVLSEAQRRYKGRKEAGRLRRLITMLKAQKQ